MLGWVEPRAAVEQCQRLRRARQGLAGFEGHARSKTSDSPCVRPGSADPSRAHRAEPCTAALDLA